jgi:hypothetical protein
MTDLRTAPVDCWHARGTADDLTNAECWRRLAGQHRGRIALTDRGVPGIYPVDYVATSTALVFRTAEGERLRRFTDGARIAFEAGVELERELWSVMLIGTARQVNSATVPQWVATFPPRPTTVTYIYVHVEPVEIRGRVWNSS